MDWVKKKGEVIVQDQRSKVSSRYKRITKAVNSEFWNSSSENTHSFYVGSYGRGTAIKTSDIDLLVELPKDEYERYDSQRGNGQSRLLQALKTAILSTYPNSNVHADGQVVVIDFSDGIKFEVLPAFQHTDIWGIWDGTYDYPDTNMGGKWLTTNPKVEQEAMKNRNDETNGLLFDTCKHLREIRDTHFSSYHLPGIVIDSFVFQHIGGWHWLKEKEKPTDTPEGTYEKQLCNACPAWPFSLRAPGSGQVVDTTQSFNVLLKVLNYMSEE